MAMLLGERVSTGVLSPAVNVTFTKPKHLPKLLDREG